MTLSIKDFVPPLFIKIYRALRPRKYGWIGDYATWEEAKKQCTGYDSKVILEKVRSGLLKVKYGEAAYERDGVVFVEERYSWPIVSAILLAYHDNPSINILDFGGSLGSTYFQHKKLFTRFPDFRWNIVEQDRFVEIGKKDFQDDNLRFFNSIEECFSDTKPNILLLGSVLQYIEKPYKLLSNLFSYNFKYIIIDRTPFDRNDRHRITIQNVDPGIYDASYPSHVFSETEFMNFLNSSNYEILSPHSPDNEIISGLSLKGFVLKLEHTQSQAQ